MLRRQQKPRSDRGAYVSGLGTLFLFMKSELGRAGRPFFVLRRCGDIQALRAIHLTDVTGSSFHGRAHPL